MPTKPPFPHVWDSTMISSFRSCPGKFFREHIENWKPHGQKVDLVAGGAFASGLEAARFAYFAAGATPVEAVANGLAKLGEHYGTFECPSDSPKSLERMSEALIYFFDKYPLPTDPIRPHFHDRKPWIEFGFATPLPDLTHPVSGDPFIFCGRSDMIADYNGAIFVDDEKTTKSLGPSWASKWDLRSQFTSYCWGLRQFGIRPAGVIVRGVAILKTKFDTQQAITYRADWQIDLWLRQVQKDIRRAMAMWETGEWDWALDEACTQYGGCIFRQTCLSPDPDPWLRTYFERKHWDPLTRTETLLEEPK